MRKIMLGLLCLAVLASMSLVGCRVLGSFDDNGVSGTSLPAGSYILEGKVDLQNANTTLLGASVREGVMAAANTDYSIMKVKVFFGYVEKTLSDLPEATCNASGVFNFGYTTYTGPMYFQAVATSGAKFHHYVDSVNSTNVAVLKTTNAINDENTLIGFLIKTSNVASMTFTAMQTALKSNNASYTQLLNAWNTALAAPPTTFNGYYSAPTTLDPAVTQVQEVGKEEALGKPVVSFNPASPMDFGQVLMGQTSPKDLMVSNTGSTTLKITKVSVPDLASFSVVWADGTATDSLVEIATGTQKKLTVTFAPGAIGAIESTLSIANNSLVNPATYVLRGTGSSSVILSLDNANLDFGGVAKDTTSTALNIVVKNDGTQPLVISSLAVTAPFAFTGIADGDTIAAGETKTLAVTFKPVALGAFNGTLTINSNANNAPAKVVTLTGKGIVTGASILLSTDTFNLGRMLDGSEVTFSLNISNYGQDPLTITGLDTTLGYVSFKSPTTPITINSLASQDVVFSLTPPASAKNTTLDKATVTLVSNTGTTNGEKSTLYLSGSIVASRTAVVDLGTTLTDLPAYFVVKITPTQGDYSTVTTSAKFKNGDGLSATWEKKDTQSNNDKKVVLGISAADFTANTLSVYTFSSITFDTPIPTDSLVEVYNGATMVASTTAR